MNKAEGAQQTGLPASRWSGWHTLGVGLFLVVVSLLAVPHTLGIHVAWITLAGSLVGVTAIAGHGIKGAWRGMFIDERNMISLSRLQIVVWTVVILSAYGALALVRVQQEAASALDITLPDPLLVLMGISTTSLVGSPFLKNMKRGQAAALGDGERDKTLENQRVGLAGEVTTEGRIVSKKSVEKARWSDLFTGEEVTNVAHLDLAKIQMFFFTVILVLSYVVAVWSVFSFGCEPSSAECKVPAALPGFSEEAVTLLAISHGGYLVNKAVPAKAE